MAKDVSAEEAIAAGSQKLGGKRKSKLAQLDVDTRIRVIGTQQVLAAEIDKHQGYTTRPLEVDFLAWLKQEENELFLQLVEQWVASA